MSGSTFPWSRVAAAVWRWANLLLLAVLAAIAFEAVLPFAWSVVRPRAIPFSPPFIALVALLATSLLVYVVAEPVRIRRGQWRGLFWYPSTWLAVPLACGMAALAERLPAPLRPYTGSQSPDWQHFWMVGPVVAAVAIGLFLRQLPWRKKDGVGNTPAAGEGSGFAWKDIEEWISAGERPLRRGEKDLFQHQRIADRIVKHVAVDRRHVALLGRFGSGKTSILNLVAAALSGRADVIVVADFDVWAAPDPADVPRLALNQIINALDAHVDTIRFRGLPLAYQRLASAEPSGRLAAIPGHESASDSLELLQDLSRVLTTIGVRVLLVVQDLERAGKEFDTRHLQRLLWALRDVNGIQFLLSVDPEHAIADYPKLCDSIELVPQVEVEHVARLLKIAYDHWRTKFADIDPHPDRRRDDKLRLDLVLAGEMANYLRRTGRDTPLDALVALLDTPRALKHVLRRVDDSWNNLHGEAELADIITVWEHFANRHTEAELLELVDGVVSRLKERDGHSAAADHRGLIGLWRRCNRRIPQNQQTEWLRRLVLDAIPVSLHLATGLYDYWTGQYGIVDGAAREDIRRSIVEKVRATFRSGSELAKVLTPRQPYMIGRLITQTGAHRSAEAFDAWKDYLPGLLLDGARTDPELVVPELANLAGDEQSGIVAAGNDYPPIFINRYTIDRARMTAFFGEQLSDVLDVLASYGGDDPYAVRAREAAKRWLEELRGASSADVGPNGDAE